MGNPAGLQPPQPTTMAVAGNPSVPPQSITHFSHPHPLFLSQQGFNAQCSGCKQVDASSGPIYTCSSCNYSLHQKCSQMPKKITHPFDKNNHVLFLMTKPAYPDGTFTCDGCGELGFAFNYRCETCGIDLHISCASSPMVINRQCHHHQLNLTFAPPYSVGSFSCDVCGLSGSKNWLYRCQGCEFDVHLTCVNKPLVHQQSLPNLPLNHQPSLPNHQFHHQMLMSRSNSAPPPQGTPMMANSFAQPGISPAQYNSFPPAAGGFSQFQTQPNAAWRFATPAPAPAGHYAASAPFAAPRPMVNYGAPMIPGAGYVQQPQNTMANQMANSLVNGIASGASQAIAQQMMTEMFGGSGGGSGGGGGNGGGGNDMTGYDTGGADVIPADQGFAGDGSFAQVDAGGYDDGSY